MSKRLLKSMSVFSLVTFISRILGFIRDMVFAQLFGTVAGFDAFIIAFKIPNFLRRLFAEGAFSQAFVPILSEYRTNKSEAEVQALVSKTAGTLGGILIIVTIVGVLIAPLLILVFAPGFIDDPLRFHLAVDLLKVTFPYILFISLTALAAGVLNAYDCFGPPAFTPVLLNLSLIIVAIYLAPHFEEPMKALALGVFIAGILQLLYQFPFLLRLRLLKWPKFAWQDTGVQRVLKLMMPAILGVSVAQISLLIDTLFASFLPVGSISWLYYSERLMSFPLGVFGVALATVVLPKLSREHVKADSANFSKTMDWSIRTVLLLGVPASLGLALMSGPLIVTLFQYGKFSNFDVEMARQSLLAFSLGIPFFMLIKIFATGFYAQQNIKTPVKVAVVALFVNMILNIVLIFPLAHAGLALATSLSGILNAGLLLYLLLNQSGYRTKQGWLKYFFQLVISLIVMALFLVWVLPSIDVWIIWSGKERVFYLLFYIISAKLLYFVSLRLFGIRFYQLVSE